MCFFFRKKETTMVEKTKIKKSRNKVPGFSKKLKFFE